MPPKRSTVLPPARARATGLRLAADPAGEAARLGRRILVDPFAVVLVIDARARCQQHARLVAQGAEQVCEPLDVDAAIVVFVEAARGAGYHDDVEVAIEHPRERASISQIRRERLDAGGQQAGATPQAGHAMPLVAQTHGQRAATSPQPAISMFAPFTASLPILH